METVCWLMPGRNWRTTLPISQEPGGRGVLMWFWLGYGSRMDFWLGYWGGTQKAVCIELSGKWLGELVLYYNPISLIIVMVFTASAGYILIFYFSLLYIISKASLRSRKWLHFSNNHRYILIVYSSSSYRSVTKTPSQTLNFKICQLITSKKFLPGALLTVTRPVNGQFSPVQLEVSEAVIELQNHVMKVRGTRWRLYIWYDIELGGLHYVSQGARCCRSN